MTTFTVIDRANLIKAVKFLFTKEEISKAFDGHETGPRPISNAPNAPEISLKVCERPLSGTQSGSPTPALGDIQCLPDQSRYCYIRYHSLNRLDARLLFSRTDLGIRPKLPDKRTEPKIEGQDLVEKPNLGFERVKEV